VALDVGVGSAVSCGAWTFNFQANAPIAPSMTIVHTRVKKTIQNAVIEDEVSASETTMLLVEIEVTVVGTALVLRYVLRIATTPGDVMDAAASWADNSVGIVTSTS